MKGSTDARILSGGDDPPLCGLLFQSTLYEVNMMKAPRIGYQGTELYS